MEWHVSRRLGNQVGIFIIAWITLLDALLIWIAAQLPISIITFLLGLVVFGTLPIIALIIYWLFGLNRAAYGLDRNALTIQWGAVRQIIPMASIRRMLHGSEIAGQVRRFRGGRWPGHWVGHAYVDGLGPTLFYAAGGMDEQLVVVTPGITYVITPADLPGFVEAFEQRQKMGPTQQVAQVSIRPYIFDWELWSDRLAWVLIGAAGLACLALFGYVCFRFPGLPQLLPLHFNAAGIPDRFDDRSRAFILPLISLMSLGANSAIGVPMYLRDRISAYLIWGGTLVVQALTWIAATGIVG